MLGPRETKNKNNKNKNLDLRNEYFPFILQDNSNYTENIKDILCPTSLVQVGKIGSFIKQSIELRTGNL